MSKFITIKFDTNPSPWLHDYVEIEFSRVSCSRLLMSWLQNVVERIMIPLIVMIHLLRE